MKFQTGWAFADWSWFGRVWFFAITLLIWLALVAGTMQALSERASSDLERLARTHAPLEQALLDMEVNVIGQGMAVLEFLDRGQPEALDRVADDRLDYDRWHSELNAGLAAEPTLDEATRASRDQLDQLYGEYIEEADLLIASHQNVLGSVDRMLDDIDLAEAELIEAYGRREITQAQLAAATTVLADVRRATIDRTDVGINTLPRLVERLLGVIPVAVHDELGTRLNQIAASAGSVRSDQQTVDIHLDGFVSLRESIDRVLDDELQGLTGTATASAIATSRQSSSALATGSILALAATLGMAIGAVRYAKRRIADPVRRIEEASRRWTEGDLEVRIPTDGSAGIGELAAALNSLVERRQQAEEILRNRKDDLEQQVLDRTLELRSSEERLKALIDTLPDALLAADGENAATVIRTGEGIGLSRLARAGSVVPFGQVLETDQESYESFRGDPAQSAGNRAPQHGRQRPGGRGKSGSGRRTLACAAARHHRPRPGAKPVGGVVACPGGVSGLGQPRAANSTYRHTRVCLPPLRPRWSCLAREHR
jgi:HAMP domain-containing protein